MLSIGVLAKRAATNVQTIRFYELQGLMPSPSRSDGGQRRYTLVHADRLAFIRHARELGFPLPAIRELLHLADKPDQPCAQVDRVASDVLADVDAKIVRLESLRGELQRMVRQCRRGRVADCRIIHVLKDHTHSSCLSTEHNQDQIVSKPVR